MSETELSSDHEFFDELCTLIEEQEEKTGMSKIELLEEMDGFVGSWREHFYMTGTLW